VVGQQNKDIADTLQLRDVAMATIYWLSMGYNFSCIIASDMLFELSVCGSNAALCQITLTTCS